MADAPLIVTKAVRDTRATTPLLVHLTFSDRTTFAIYPDNPTRTYAHDLYDNFLAAGGVLE